MKRGKRQIMERNVFEEDSANNNQENSEAQSTF